MEKIKTAGTPPSISRTLRMENHGKGKLGGLLEILPPVEFCCIYGSTLHPNNKDKTTMVDYILGVADPKLWHSENLQRNPDHYASGMMHLGGAEMITWVADNIGVGVHFNPFVSWNDKMFKYGVVRSSDLIEDLVGWRKFYLAGRLQKPVNVIVDDLDIQNLNNVNLRAATAAALLLLPSNFHEDDLYAQICGLSYMGDLRMHFAEDRNKVKRIVHGQYNLFQKMYKPFLEEYAAKELLSLPITGDACSNISQDLGLSSVSSLISSLPLLVRDQMGGKQIVNECGQITRETTIKSKAEAAQCLQRLLRRKVMFSSARQAFAGLLTAGAVHGCRYVASKMRKAWKSWR